MKDKAFSQVYQDNWGIYKKIHALEKEVRYADTVELFAHFYTYCTGWELFEILPLPPVYGSNESFTILTLKDKNSNQRDFCTY